MACKNEGHKDIDTITQICIIFNFDTAHILFY